jgi:endonuclease-3
VLYALRREKAKWGVPVVTVVAKTSRDPFKVLISAVLSARTLDTTTAEASERLFKLASTPEEMLGLSVSEIEEAISKVGFYKTKAKHIKAICKELVERYGSRVPDSVEELIKLKGVGRKTANLVVSIGYGKQGICVDTHVHRISNRLGYISTKTPFESEMVLRKKLPMEYWIEYNDILVAFGQNVCRPVSPICSMCPVSGYCSRRGVTKSR